MIIWYKNSVLASVVSIFSCMLVVLGVTGAFDGQLAALILVIPGVGGLLLASWISDRKQHQTAFRNWYNTRNPNCDALVHSSGEFAAQLYSAMPTEPMLQYIRALNPAAAAAIKGKTAPAPAQAPVYQSTPAQGSMYNSVPTPPPAAEQWGASNQSGGPWSSSPDL